MALGDVSLVIVRKEAGIWVVGAAQQGLQPELVLGRGAGASYSGRNQGPTMGHLPFTRKGKVGCEALSKQ